MSEIPGWIPKSNSFYSSGGKSSFSLEQKYGCSEPAILLTGDDAKKYKEICEDAKRLYALEAAGVDNWEGFDDAMADAKDKPSSVN